MIGYLVTATLLSILLPGTLAIFPFGSGAFIFQTSTSRAPNNTAGSFTSNISFDAISNVSNVVVAVSQNMGRSLDLNDPDDGTARRINSTVFLFKDGNWTSLKLRKRRSTFDLGKQITNQVFAAVNSFMNTTANQTTFDLMDKLLNASAINNRSSRKAPSDPFMGLELFDSMSQEFLNDIESLESFSALQRSIARTISRKLSITRSLGWRILFDDFKDFLQVVNTTMATLHNLFNNAVDEFASTLETNEISNCWPTEPSLTPLNTLFRSSADNMGQCYGKVFQESRSILDSVRGNLSTPLNIPEEIVEQFNYCNSISATNNNNNNDVFGLLTTSTCLAKIPLLLEDFTLTRLLAYNHLIAQGQRTMIDLKANLVRCAFSELNAIQEQSMEWQSAYGQCLNSGGSSTTLLPSY